MAESHRAGGTASDWRASLHGLGQSLLAMLRVRAELLGIELAEEQARLKATVILAALAAIFLGLGLQILAFLIIVVFWDTHRLWAIAGVAIAYFAIAALAALWIRRLWRGAPPFAASREELRKDMDALRGRHE